MIASGLIKKWFLVLAALTLLPVALLYGVSPRWFASVFLGVSELDRDLVHILRAMMCLYLGFGAFWVFAAFSGRYRDAALLTVVLFPAGLVIGRIISYFADGHPAPLLFIYLLFELIQVPLAIWVFKLPD